MGLNLWEARSERFFKESTTKSSSRTGVLERFQNSYLQVGVVEGRHSLHPSDEDLSLETPVLHPSNEDLSLETPVLHPSAGARVDLRDCP